MYRILSPLVLGLGNNLNNELLFGNKIKRRISKQWLQEKYFLPTNSYTNVCVSGIKNVRF